jgi:hypothetical protein
MKNIGPAWTEKGGRPKQGYFTRRDAKAKLDEILTDARQGRIPDPGERSGKTFGDATAELLRYVEQEKARRPSTVRDYRYTAESTLEPEFGKDTPLEAITAERVDAYMSHSDLEAGAPRGSPPPCRHRSSPMRRGCG